MAGRLLDPDLRDLILGLAQSNPGLCVLSSRQALTDLDGLGGLAARREDLDDLPRAVAVRLLRRLQITGTDRGAGGRLREVRLPRAQPHAAGPVPLRRPPAATSAASIASAT